MVQMVQSKNPWNKLCQAVDIKLEVALSNGIHKAHDEELQVHCHPLEEEVWTLRASLV